MKDISGAKDSVFFELYVPLVFIANYRRRVFDARAIDVLCGTFADVCSDAQTTLVEMDAETPMPTCSCSILPKWLSPRW
jgi:hypothetical protein